MTESPKTAPPEMESPEAESPEAEPPESEPRDDDAAFSSGVVRLAIIFEGLLAVAAYFLGELVNRPPGERILWNVADALWGVAAAVPLLGALCVLMRLPLAAVEQLREFGRDFLLPMFREATWWQIVVICVLAGLGEEMLFRGVVQLGLTDAIGGTEGIVLGLAIASITFGLAHAVTRLYTIAATLVGLYFGGLLLFTDNLLVPIVAHAVYDLGAFVYLFRTSRENTGATSDERAAAGDDAGRTPEEES